MPHEFLSTLKISPANDLGARTALFISESSFLLGQHLFVRRDGHYRAKGPGLPNRQVCYDSVIEMHVCPKLLETHSNFCHKLIRVSYLEKL